MKIYLQAKVLNEWVQQNRTEVLTGLSEPELCSLNYSQNQLVTHGEFGGPDGQMLRYRKDRNPSQQTGSLLLLSPASAAQQAAYCGSESRPD